jgi:hypothetical protein
MVVFDPDKMSSNILRRWLMRTESMNPQEKKKNPPKKKRSGTRKQKDPKPISSSQKVEEDEEVNLPPFVPPELMRQ